MNAKQGKEVRERDQHTLIADSQWFCLMRSSSDSSNARGYSFVDVLVKARISDSCCARSILCTTDTAVLAARLLLPLSWKMELEGLAFCSLAQTTGQRPLLVLVPVILVPVVLVPVVLVAVSVGFQGHGAARAAMASDGGGWVRTERPSRCDFPPSQATVLRTADGS